MDIVSDSLKKLLAKLEDTKIILLKRRIPDHDTKYDFQILIKNGKQLFYQFFEVGCEAIKVNITSFGIITNNSEYQVVIMNIADRIADIKDYLYDYLDCYSDVCVQIYESQHEFDEKTVCEIRSGIQFMLDLFMGTSESVYLAFKNFNDDELIDDIDCSINYARDCGEFKVPCQEISILIPKSHAWWFFN